MNPLVVVLAVVVVFGMLVTIHEMGHLVVAKLMGVKVLEFSVGFGPALAKIQRGETTYGIRIIPLGGYVKLAGMDDGETGPRSFNAKPVWRRILIIAAGSVTNLVLPFFIFFFAFVGTAGPPLQVRSVSAGFPAEAAGLQPSDKILAVNDKPVTAGDEFRSIVNGSGGQPVTIRIQRGSQPPRDVTVTPRSVDGRYVIGIVPTGSFDIVTGAKDSVKEWYGQLSAIGTGFVALVRGQIPGGIAGKCGPSGPVGIVRATGEAAQAGVVPLAVFAGFLSLNLGILNLMPIPALDGGRLFFLLIEAVRRRPINPLREQMVHQAGLVVLLGLILLISFNDIARLGQSFSDLVTSCSG
ncbi:MAG: M50 family metallopeptidase [Candidatus Dormibacteraeota bacterium]|nr:M50 family metallopeptidase [Candidatus Dormibacteraeota bacterium]